MSVSRPGSRRVVLSVSPRMLEDTLTVALREQDLEVEIHPDCPARSQPVDEERFDLAVTSGALPRGVAADVVVVIPSDPQDRAVRILRPSQPEERREVRTLDGVLSLVRNLLGDES